MISGGISRIVLFGKKDFSPAPGVEQIGPVRLELLLGSWCAESEVSSLGREGDL
jgi:hypothetical protein